MLFNSYGFLLVFLPLVLVGFGAFRTLGVRWAMAWLLAASLVFYGWWNPPYLALLAGSIVGNYLLGMLQDRSHRRRERGSRWALGVGIGLNLGLLGWFKYANLLADTVDALTGAGLDLPAILLPLAISFFTFQQVAYQVDAWKGTVRDHGFLDYALFVSFFPQLIAGPIVHHAQVMPQFRRPGFALRDDHLAVGLTLLIFGLVKKVLIADKVAPAATAVFAAAEGGAELTLIEAWGGLLAYTLQLYFDFSGYSDMAIGLARCFGIVLPQNFDSPYQATNIIDFWRRWHITLSTFLRDYLYIPLGGGRRGAVRRYANLVITMLLGGLWHGASWTFLAWGGLHGGYLLVNHAWRGLAGARGWRPPGFWARRRGQLLTLLAWAVSLAFFRAESFAGAGRVLAGCAGLNGVSVSASLADHLAWAGAWLRFEGTGAFGARSLFLLVPALTVAVAAPNTMRLLGRWGPVCDREPEPTRWAWSPSIPWLLVTAALAVVVLLELAQVSEFLYFIF